MFIILSVLLFLLHGCVLLYVESGASGLGFDHGRVNSLRRGGRGGDGVCLSPLAEGNEQEGGSPAPATDEPRRSFEPMAAEKLASFAPWQPADIQRSDSSVQTEVTERPWS